tara:strand:- start:67 stop:291 length:225 start_codon:yes stop_codon:yes gene_type:complete
MIIIKRKENKFLKKEIKKKKWYAYAKVFIKYISLLNKKKLSDLLIIFSIYNERNNINKIFFYKKNILWLAIKYY